MFCERYVFGTVLLVFILVNLNFSAFANGLVLMKKSAAPERTSDDYPEYQLGVKYDEYPMVVPKKKAALLLDRLMVALQQAIDEEDGDERRTSADGKSGTRNRAIIRPDETMDLQRRGHGSMSGQQKGRVYWRCYFNAVTCFK